MWIHFFVVPFKYSFHTKMFKCTMRAFILILTLVRCHECLRVPEGEMAQLDFLYPCNSTKVTLQRSNAAPFYSSENSNPDVILQSNKNVTNRKGNDTCSLQLTINPISRHDEGTYIPIAYKNGRNIIPEEERRIWLRVDYPPGKASCELPRGHISGQFLKLDCTASIGKQDGQIVCYQNGKKLIPVTLPHESHRIVDQTFLARLVNPVYCCSSISAKIKDRCECADWGWHPNHGLLINIEPCAAVSTAISSTLSKGNGVNFTTPTPNTFLIITVKNSTLSQMLVFREKFIPYLYASLCLSGLSFTICVLCVIYCVLFWKRKSKT